MAPDFNTTPVSPEHQESADYFEELASEYEEKGSWGIAEILRGAISKLGEVDIPQKAIKCPCGRLAATASEDPAAHAEKKCVSCYEIDKFISLTSPKAAQS